MSPARLSLLAGLAVCGVAHAQLDLYYTGGQLLGNSFASGTIPGANNYQLYSFATPGNAMIYSNGGGGGTSGGLDDDRVSPSIPVARSEVYASASLDYVSSTARRCTIDSQSSASFYNPPFPIYQGSTSSGLQIYQAITARVTNSRPVHMWTTSDEVFGAISSITDLDGRVYQSGRCVPPGDYVILPDQLVLSAGVTDQYYTGSAYGHFNVTFDANPCDTPWTWTQRNSAGPSARGWAAGGYDAARDRVLLFGGWDGAQRLNDLWAWDGVSWALLQSHNGSDPNRPSPRRVAAMVYSSAQDLFYLFAGDTESQGESNEFWSLNPHTLTWTNLTVPTGPHGYWEPAMVYDKDRNVCVLYGTGTGGNNPTPLAETWEFNGNSWTRFVGAPNPGIRISTSMVYDPVNHRTILFGGGTDLSQNANHSDTWSWNGNSWTLVATTGPSARYRAGFEYDASKDKIVLFGGNSGGALSHEVWELNGATWAGPTIAPFGAGAHFCVYDDAASHIISFGGLNANASAFDADMWVYSGSQISRQPSDIVAFLGQPSHVSVEVSGPADSYRWYADGAPFYWSTGPTLDVPSWWNIPGVHQVRCIVTFPCGDQASRTATITLQACYPNCDASTVVPILNVNDFICFLNKFAASDTYANCDDSTTPPVLNVLDFTCFLNKFAAGCP